MPAWIFAIGPAIVCVMVIAWVRRSRWSIRLSDHPNERSLHSKPTLRIGGIGVTAAALAFAALVASGPLAVALVAALFLALISLIDDIRSLPVAVRLPAHLAAAILVVLSLGAAASWGWVEAAIAVFAIAWMTNLYNFMDGSDGLAGGMALIGFAALAMGAMHSEAAPLSLAAIAIASSAAGFLCYNFPPARVFLGDSGSVPLGFLAGSFGVLGVATGAWPAWFPLLVFAAFIVDASVTLLRRLIRRERIWRAHRSHYYQRLVLAGWTRRRLAFAAYGLMFANAATAVWSLYQGTKIQYAIIAVWLAIYAWLLVALERRIGRSHAAS